MQIFYLTYKERISEPMARKLIETQPFFLPWSYYGSQLTEEDLKVICDGFPAAALDRTGVGDLSIIRTYQKYKEETPAIEEIRIWSYDKHLEDYHEVITLRNRRNRN